MVPTDSNILSRVDDHFSNVITCKKRGSEVALDKQKAERRPLNATAALVLETLRKDQRPLSAYDLMDKLRDSGIRAPNTVYRALNRLMADSSVHRLETLNAYVACTQSNFDQDCDPIFAICDNCGNVEEFAAASVTASVNKWAKAKDFALNSITVELRGTCGKCHVGANSETAKG